jgi:polar amino acid transport system substrate-binding protein
MKPALLLTFLLGLCGMIANAADSAPPSRPLNLLTEEWGPITFEEHGKAQGFAVDVVSEIQKLIKTDNVIQVVPWTRGFHEAKSQPNVVLFTVFRSKEREKLFTLLGPVATCEVSFYGLADANLPIKNIADAKRMNAIAAKADTWFASTMEKAGFKNIMLTKDPQQEARLLIAGRVNLISNDLVAIEKALNDIGKKDLKLKRYLTLEKGELYIAFSKGTQPATIDKWKTALETLKKNGTFAALQKKWLPDSKALPGVELVGYGTGSALYAEEKPSLKMTRTQRQGEDTQPEVPLSAMP